MKRSIVISLLLLLVSCGGGDGVKLLSKEAFESKVDGRLVSLYTLKNSSGMTLQLTNYGGRVVALWTPDREGRWADVVIGYDSLSRYMSAERIRFLGAAVGRYANRIDGGRFSLDGVDYQLSPYSGGHSLHGGERGFDSVVWSVDSLAHNEIVLSYLSSDMEEGFPGALSVKMRYRLSDEGAFEIDYWATCDRATPINLTHHGFFNLRGAGSGEVLDHIVRVAAQSYAEIDERLIPTGQLKSVEGCGFDFRTAQEIGGRYDICYILNREEQRDGLHFAASLYDGVSGRRMEVWTSAPAMQLFTGNSFPDNTRGKGESYFSRCGGVAFETEHIPNSINEPISQSHPSTILRPGEIYHQRCIYRFGVEM